MQNEKKISYTYKGLIASEKESDSSCKSVLLGLILIEIFLNIEWVFLYLVPD